MTQNDLFLLITRACYLLIAMLSIYSFFRIRTQLYLNRALLFSTLALSIIFGWLEDIFPQYTFLQTLSSMALVAHPFFLLQLVHIFRPVPSLLRKLNLFGLIASEIFVALGGSSRPIPVTLFVVAYFVGIELYCAGVFVQGALTTTGVVRWRLGFASLGSGALGLIILLVGFAVVFAPENTSMLRVVFEVFALISALCFYMSFVTPRWLRQVIQYHQLHNFLRARAETKSTQRHSETLLALCQATLDAVGGQGVFIVEHDTRNQLFHLRQTGVYPTFTNSPPVADFGATFNVAFTLQTPQYSSQPETWGVTEKQLAAQFKADTIYYVPVALSERVWGVVLIFLRGTPIFATDDLHLLMLYAEQTAIALDASELLERQTDLVEQLREHSSELKQTLEDERRQFFNNTPFLLGVTDFANQFVLTNRAWERKLGYSHEELKRLRLQNLIYPDDLPEALVHLDRLVQGVTEVSFASRGVCRDGSLRWFMWNCSRSSAHQAIYTVAQDITEQKLAEAESERLYGELVLERERLNNIIENIPGIVWEISGDFEGKYTTNFISNYMEKMLGYTVEEWLATPGFGYKIMHPDDLPHALEVTKAIFQSGQTGRNEFRWFTKDGRPLWVASYLSVIKDEHGQSVGMRGVVIDINDQKHAEEIHAQLAAIVESSEDAIVGKTLDGIITSWNTGAERMYGYSRDEMLGRSIKTILPPEHANDLETIYEQIRNGKSHSYVELPTICRDGHRILVSKVVSPIKDSTGKVIGVSSISRDITPQKQAEAELKMFANLLAESNKELQNFAYVASHDLQEPLRKVEAFGSRLILKYGDKLDEQGVDYLNRMQKATRRMSRLIQDLLSYSRVTSLALPFQMIDLNDIVRDVLSDLEYQIEESNAQIHVDDLRSIEADRVQISQLLQNLVGNSLKYRKPDVAPQIWVRGKILDENSDAPRYELSVTDNGIGFDEKYTDRIFDLFQRLHGNGEYEGTGMGLAICRKIVERHGGTLTAQSKPNRGAIFTINLPVYQTESNAILLQL